MGIVVGKDQGSGLNIMLLLRHRERAMCIVQPEHISFLRLSASLLLVVDQIHDLYKAIPSLNNDLFF